MTYRRVQVALNATAAQARNQTDRCLWVEEEEEEVSAHQQRYAAAARGEKLSY